MLILISAADGEESSKLLQYVGAHYLCVFKSLELSWQIFN